MKAELSIDTIYQTEGHPYKCLDRNDETYILQRITDNWTLTAQDCRFDDNGNLYWSGSTKGHWARYNKENQMLYYYFRTGSRNKIGSEISYWCRTNKYPTKTALRKAFNPGMGYARQVTEVLTAEQVLEKYPNEAIMIFQAYDRCLQ